MSFDGSRPPYAESRRAAHRLGRAPREHPRRWPPTARIATRRRAIAADAAHHQAQAGSATGPSVPGRLMWVSGPGAPGGDRPRGQSANPTTGIASRVVAPPCDASSQACQSRLPRESSYALYRPTLGSGREARGEVLCPNQERARRTTVALRARPAAGRTPFAAVDPGGLTSVTGTDARERPGGFCARTSAVAVTRSSLAEHVLSVGIRTAAARAYPRRRLDLSELNMRAGSARGRSGGAMDTVPPASPHRRLGRRAGGSRSGPTSAAAA